MFRLIQTGNNGIWPALRAHPQVLTGAEVRRLLADRADPLAPDAPHVIEWLDGAPKPGDTCPWYVAALFVCVG